MTNLTELIRKYKETKDKQILDKFFVLIKKVIDKKAKYLFYQKKFKIKKYYFRLKDLKQIEFEDIIQELYVAILKLIENYNPKQKFEPYFYGFLWNYHPSFIMNKEFLHFFKDIKESDFKNEENENVFEEILVIKPEIAENKIDWELFERELSEDEKKVYYILKDNPKLNQSQIADKLKVTQPWISMILKEIANKLKNYL